MAKENDDIAVIYTITNMANKKLYVGYTIDFEERRHNHFSKLKRNSHPNQHLQAAYNKYGCSSLIMEVLDTYPVDLIMAMESYWIGILNTINPKYGYNMMTSIPNTNVKIYSKESRMKMRASQLGKHDKERNNFYGKKHSEESRKKISLNKKGKPSPKRKRVIQFDKDGNKIKIWDSIMSVEEGGFSFKAVSQCLNNNNKSQGYIWKYEKEEQKGKR